MGVFFNMHHRMPSKRVLALTIVTVAFIAAVILLRPHDDTPRPIFTLSGESNRTQLDEKDTDGDGLRDWEEDLWGFSSVNPDTDGDGIDDATEAANERTLQEEQESALIDDILGTISTDTNLSRSDILARTLVEEVVAFQSAGISLDGNTSNSIAQKLVDSLAGGVTIDPPVVSVSQIKTTNETPETLRSYGNAVGSIIGGKPTAETNELIVLAQLGQTSDYSTLAQLATVKQSYRSMVNQLMLIPVPTGLVQAHVDFVNAMLATSETFDTLAKIEEDPLASIVGIQAYVQFSSNMATSFDVIQSYLNKRVVFQESESGYSVVNEESL